MRAAAGRTNGLVSSGRWYQLESGYQKIRGQEIPIGTTAATIAAAAKAIDWDINEALSIAGFPPQTEPPPAPSTDLTEVPTDDLLGEIRRRINYNVADNAKSWPGPVWRAEGETPAWIPRQG